MRRKSVSLFSVTSFSTHQHSLRALLEACVAAALTVVLCLFHAPQQDATCRTRKEKRDLTD